MSDTTTALRWWVSWYGHGAFAYHGPWWISGAEAGGAGRRTFVAAVLAETEDEAREVITSAHDEPHTALQWRFVDVRPADWEPFSERFPQASWMRWPA